MKTIILLTYSLTLLTADRIYAQNKTLTGEYVKYSEPVSNMRLQRRLILNCDHSALATYRFDIINETVYGTWRIHGDTVKVTFNSDNPKAGHWDTESKFLIDRKRLIQLVTKINGQEIEDKELLDKLVKASRRDNTYKRTAKYDCE